MLEGFNLEVRVGEGRYALISDYANDSELKLQKMMPVGNENHPRWTLKGRLCVVWVHECGSTTSPFNNEKVLDELNAHIQKQLNLNDYPVVEWDTDNAKQHMFWLKMSTDFCKTLIA